MPVRLASWETHPSTTKRKPNPSIPSESSAKSCWRSRLTKLVNRAILTRSVIYPAKRRTPLRSRGSLRWSTRGGARSSPALGFPRGGGQHTENERERNRAEPSHSGCKRWRPLCSVRRRMGRGHRPRVIEDRCDLSILPPLVPWLGSLGTCLPFLYPMERRGTGYHLRGGEQLYPALLPGQPWARPWKGST